MVNGRIKLLSFFFLVTLGLFVFSVNVLAVDRYLCTDSTFDGTYERCSSSDASGNFDWGSIACTDCGDGGCINGECRTCTDEWYCQGGDVWFRSSACSERVYQSCSDGCDTSTNKCNPPPCIDNDNDGYGKNCAAGNDCNDNDKRLTNNCNQCNNGVIEAGEICQPGDTRTSSCDSSSSNCGGSKTDTCRSDCSGWNEGSCSGGTSCSSAPTTQCIGNNRVTYDSGSCSGGTCNYPSNSQYCSWGCSGNSCNSKPADPKPPKPVDLCKGVSCTNPPRDFCTSDGNGYETYSDIGTCSSGQCSYAKSTIPCQYGCSGGQCKPAPIICGGLNEKCCSTGPACTTAGLDCLSPKLGYSDTPTSGEYKCQVPPPKCEDNDNDGYGKNCALGSDCNDDDRRLTNNCNECGNKVYEPGNNEKCDWGTNAAWIDTSKSCGNYPHISGQQRCSDSCQFENNYAEECQSCGDGTCQEGLEDYKTCSDDCVAPVFCTEAAWDCTDFVPEVCPDSGLRTSTCSLVDLTCENPDTVKPETQQTCTPPPKVVKKPDLKIKKAVKITPSELIAGEEVELTFEIKNVGTGDSVEHSRNVIDFGDGSSVTKSTSTLKTTITPGGTSKFKKSHIYNKPGTYTVRAEVIDKDDSDTNNNIREKTITIEARDLCRGVVCRNPPATQCVDADNSVIYSGGVCNAGECIYIETQVPCYYGCGEGGICKDQPEEKKGELNQKCRDASSDLPECNQGLVCTEHKVGYTNIGSTCEKPKICIDKDNDGYGKNCAAGNDCNDNDKRLTNNCNQCNNGVIEAGEICQPGQTIKRTCYGDVNACGGARTDTCRADCKGWVQGSSCFGGNSCTLTKPNDECKNENTLIKYSAQGCSGGDCKFVSKEIHCEYGCLPESVGSCKSEPSRPDIAITSITSDISDPAFGDRITFTVNLKNVGDTVTKDLTDTFSFECDDGYGEETVPSIEKFMLFPNKTFSYDKVVSRPGKSSCTFTAEVSTTDDSNQNNNKKSITVDVNGTGPVLEVYDITYSPDKPKVNDDVKFSFNVRNIGDEVAKNITINREIPCKNFGTTGIGPFTSALASLDPDEVETFFFDRKFLGVGSCKFVAIASAENDNELGRNRVSIAFDVMADNSTNGTGVVVGNETNTTNTTNVTAPDLDVWFISYNLTSRTVGEPVNFSIHIKNIGDATSHDLYVANVMSCDGSNVGVGVPDNLPKWTIPSGVSRTFGFEEVFTEVGSCKFTFFAFTSDDNNTDNNQRSIAFNVAEGGIVIGKDLIEDEKEEITLNDWFLLGGETIFEYNGADRATSSNPKARFRRIMEEGKKDDTIDVSTKSGKGTLRYGGGVYKFAPADGSSVNNYDIKFDLNGDGIIGGASPDLNLRGISFNITQERVGYPVNLSVLVTNDGDAASEDLFIAIGMECGDGGGYESAIPEDLPKYVMQPGDKRTISFEEVFTEAGICTFTFNLFTTYDGNSNNNKVSVTFDNVKPEITVVEGCTDSDGGKNEFEAGSVLLNGIDSDDSCSGNDVVEYFCDTVSFEGELYDVLGKETIECESSCSEGACIDEEIITGTPVPIKGSVDAPVLMEEYCGFGGPFCGRFYRETLPLIEKNYIDTGKVKLSFNHFTFDFHPDSKKAAEAAECAKDQGAFWEMHDKMFDNQDNLDVEDLKKYAITLDLDEEEFDSCLDSGKKASIVESQEAAGKERGVTGTPTFYINDTKVVGAQRYDAFEEVIDEALGEDINRELVPNLTVKLSSTGIYYDTGFVVANTTGRLPVRILITNEGKADAIGFSYSYGCAAEGKGGSGGGGNVNKKIAVGKSVVENIDCEYDITGNQITRYTVNPLDSPYSETNSGHLRVYVVDTDEEEAISRNDYFVLGGKHLFRYVKATKTTETSPQLELKHIESGDAVKISTLEGLKWALKFGGEEYTFINATNSRSSNYKIQFDLNGNGHIEGEYKPGSCTDTEYTTDYYQKGSLYQDNVWVQSDHCSSTSTGYVSETGIYLREYYYEPNTCTPTSEMIKCDCNDGVCVPEEMVVEGEQLFDTLREGFQINYIFNGDETHEIKVYEANVDRAKFEINGETTSFVREGDPFLLFSRSMIVVDSVDGKYVSFTYIIPSDEDEIGDGTCVDTDHGNDIFTFGRTADNLAGGGAAYTHDICSGSTLFEGSCVNDMIHTTEFYCINGCDDSGRVCKLGEDLDSEVIKDENSNISLNDRFLLGDGTIFEYDGSDRETVDNPVSSFRRILDDDDKDDPIEVLTRFGKGVIRYGGGEYKFVPVTDALVRNYDIRVDLNGDGIIGSSEGPPDLVVSLSFINPREKNQYPLIDVSSIVHVGETVSLEAVVTNKGGKFENAFDFFTGCSSGRSEEEVGNDGETGTFENGLDTGEIERVNLSCEYGDSYLNRPLTHVKTQTDEGEINISNNLASLDIYSVNPDEGSTIRRFDYFVLGEGFLLQYKGADKLTSTGLTTAKFENIVSGDTIEVALNVSDLKTGVIRIGGGEYKFSALDGNTRDSNLQIDLNGDGVIESSEAEEEIEEIKLLPSGSKGYTLSFVDGSGNTAKLPLAYAPGGENLRIGDSDDDTRVIENQTITRNDYFIITDSTNGERKTYAMRYVSSLKSSETSPQIEFKDLGSGDAIKIDYRAAEDGQGRLAQGNADATLRFGGGTFKIWNASLDTSSNFDIVIDLDGDGTLESAGTGGIGNAQDLIQSNVIDITSDGGAKASLEFRPTNLTTNASTGGTAGSIIVSLQPSNAKFKISAANGKIDFSEYTGEVVPVPEPDLANYPYPFIENDKINTMIVVGDDADSMDVISAADIVTSLVFATETRFDDSAKLASEVADVRAQNVIAIGTPCSNAAVADLLGNPANCSEGYVEGRAKIELIGHDNGNVALIVGGYEPIDTRTAARVLSQYDKWQESGVLAGTEIEVVRKLFDDIEITDPVTISSISVTNEGSSQENDGGFFGFITGQIIGIFR